MSLLQRARGEEADISILVVLERLEHRSDLLLHQLHPLWGVAKRGSYDLQGFGDIEPDVRDGITGELEKHVENVIADDLERQRGRDGLYVSISSMLTVQDHRCAIVRSCLP